MVDQADDPAAYVPQRGEVVWLTFSPQVGREQAGRRPALVLSDGEYNAKVGLAIVCPITSKVKGYPFEVPLPANSTVQGVILADHVRSVDWSGRSADKACDAEEKLVQRVVETLNRVIAER